MTTTSDSNTHVLNDYHNACNLLAAEVNGKLFADPNDPDDDGRQFYWIADETGGLCDFGDCDVLSCTDMALILKHDLSFKEYEEWRDATLERPDGTPPINLRSWIMGARYEMLRK